ncbi:MAG: hypothetical protein IKT60_03295 [Clostridia bacterium]|nr:hypothetical protein [Clostridia bacterium]
MDRIFADFTAECGPVKPMHAVNNGPLKVGQMNRIGNFEDYCAAGFPYARNHDAALSGKYGGEHAVDVHFIFPDFDADETDPASYDFCITDALMADTVSSGTEVFYRLGTKIEHWPRHYGTLPPKDYAKWARIAEHIIRHYTEGWADGFHYKITYWEIWNEPDMNDETWAGTREEFFAFFAVAAKHLKACFPHLKFGGPALSSSRIWPLRMLTYLKEQNCPLDFFSWHVYAPDMQKFIERAEFIRDLLADNGFGEVENICNEWNYIEGWSGEEYIRSMDAIHGLRGSAFSAAVMLWSQYSPIDMLMYYDLRPCEFNGLFDFYTYRKLKGYYPFYMFNVLYRLGTACPVETSEGLYAVAAKGEDGCALMATNFSEESREFTFEAVGGTARYEIILLSENYDAEVIGHFRPGKSIYLPAMSTVLLRGIKE